MAINNRKLTDAEITAKGVIAAPDKLTGTAAENKAIFDRLISDKLQDKFNGLIDDLLATSGALEIGFTTTGMSASTVKGAIDELLTSIGNAVKFTEQTLTESQKTQARNNIGVSSGQVAVNSVNGKTGAVVLDPDDIGAYEKPGTGIPKTDLASAVQTSLGLADTALQSSALTPYQQKASIVSISLPTASWAGSSSLYSQTITVSGSTANSKIDLQADSTVIAQLVDDGTNGLYVVNNSNVLTAYAVGERPTADLTVQATMYEVSA